MNTKKQTLPEILRAAGFALFDREPYGAKACAQANLSGRTHFADDSTLRYFHARIVSARILESGAAFMLIESSAMDYQNTRRGFRWAVFDVDGNCIQRPALESAVSTAEKARGDFWAFWESFDLNAHYSAMLSERAQRMARIAKESRDAARKLAPRKSRAES